MFTFFHSRNLHSRTFSVSFAEVMKASQQAIERGVKDCLFIDYKRRSGHFDVTTVASIKEITDKVLFCAFLSLQILSDKMKRLSAFGQDKLSQLWLFDLWQWTIKGKIADGENGRRWLPLFLSFWCRAVTVCSTSPRTPLRGSTVFTFIQLLSLSATKTPSRSSKYQPVL